MTLNTVTNYKKSILPTTYFNKLSFKASIDIIALFTTNIMKNIHINYFVLFYYKSYESVSDKQ